MQLITHKLGGKVGKTDKSTGKAELNIKLDEAPLFGATPKNQVVWMSHGDLVTEVPAGFEVVATSNDCPIAAMQNRDRQIYGVQFHPEVRHTEYGTDLLKQFAFDICGAAGDWSMENFIEIEIIKIRQQVGDKKVLLGLSGGVDSSVVGVLLQKAIGDQLTCIFVDHGLLRKNEGDQVMEMLGNKFGLNIIRVDAKDRFLDKLAGVKLIQNKNVKSSETNLFTCLTMKRKRLLAAKSFFPCARYTLYRCD